MIARTTILHVFIQYYFYPDMDSTACKLQRMMVDAVSLRGTLKCLMNSLIPLVYGLGEGMLKAQNVCYEILIYTRYSTVAMVLLIT